MAEIVPTIGRIVLYRLSQVDVDIIENRRLTLTASGGNRLEAGRVYPAMIVQVWGDNPAAAVNLKVMLDGHDTHWATSRVVGTEDGTYHWMPYQKAVAAGEIAPTLHTNGPRPVA